MSVCSVDGRHQIGKYSQSLLREVDTFQLHFVKLRSSHSDCLLIVCKDIEVVCENPEVTQSLL